MRAFLLIAALLLVGCGPRVVETEQQLQERLMALPSDAPEWIHAPHSTTHLGASGAALPMRAGIQFQQIEANGRAKERLMQTLSEYTRQVAIGVYGAMGVELESASLESIGLMSASEAIGRAERKALYWAPSNELYIHIAVERAQASQVATEAIRLFIRSRESHEAAYRALGDEALISRAARAAFDQQPEYEEEVSDVFDYLTP